MHTLNMCKSVMYIGISYLSLFSLSEFACDVNV